MAVKSTMGDMHLMLMEQMERLCSCEKEDLKCEIERTEAMADMGKAIVANATLMVRMSKMQSRGEAPLMLTEGVI